MPDDGIKKVQQALKDAGFNPGDIDGVWGRASIGALKRFQAKAGLDVDGVLGPKSRAALFGTPTLTPTTSETTDLVWYQEALNLMGTLEKPGPGSNPAIINWARDLDIDYASDDIAWCGLFVAHCVGSTLTEESLPANPLGARNWRRFGTRTDPRLGAVLVFWRGDPQGSLGHVGFYHSEDATAYHVLGGNQSDKVSVARVAKSRLLDARWPLAAAGLSSSTVIASADGGLSHNEQ